MTPGSGLKTPVNLLLQITVVHIPPIGSRCYGKSIRYGHIESIFYLPKIRHFGSHKIGHVASFTGDMLAASLSPPTIYGDVTFEGGGKYMLDFTDCELDDLSPGTPVAVSFRRKYYDAKRDISGYFWKAVPVKEVK